MDLLTYLKFDERFRERKNKNKGIANLISVKYAVDIPQHKRSDFIGDILSMDRAWRKYLKDRPELRGSDYDDKEILEQEKQIELGYEPQMKLKL